MAAGRVIPKLALRAARIVAQVDVFDEFLRGVRAGRIRAHWRGVTQIGELLVAAFAAIWADNPHVVLNGQCRLG